MKGKVVSLPIKKISFSEENTQSDLTKVILQVCKSGEVTSHGLYFEEESLSLAQESIKNKPLLCAYEIDEEGNKTDFKGHELEYKIIKDGNNISLKIEYIEQPVGIIPETNNFTITDIDGEKWVVVEGYLFNEYCSDAVRILEESDGEKAVSMEITVLEGANNEEDGLFHITLFSFLGVTLLGKSHNPAISGANIRTFSQSDTFALQFSEIVKRVNNTINKGGEKVDERQKIIDKFESLKGNEQFETIIADTELDEVELEKQLFALSNNQLERAVREVVNSFEVEVTNRWNETYKMQKYYVEDIIVDDNIVICEDNQNYYAYYGIPYTMQGDKAVLNFENAKRYVKGDWREYQGETIDITVNPMFSAEIESISNRFEEELERVKVSFDVNETKEYKDLKAEMFELQTSYATLEEEATQLREFKSNFEKEQREKSENEVFEKYSDLKEVEGYSSIFENKSNFSLEDLERDLKVLAFDNGIVLGGKKKFSKTEKETIKIPVGESKNDVVDPYGGLLDKYLK